jgi:hypothetical protein
MKNSRDIQKELEKISIFSSDNSFQDFEIQPLEILDGRPPNKKPPDSMNIFEGWTTKPPLHQTPPPNPPPSSKTTKVESRTFRNSPLPKPQPKQLDLQNPSLPLATRSQDNSYKKHSRQASIPIPERYKDHPRSFKKIPTDPYHQSED